MIMKINKYVTVLLAVVAMAATTVSCNRDNDITGDPFADHSKPNAKGEKDYWINFELSNAGSLSAEAQALFPQIVGTVVYQNKDIKIYDQAIYNTLSYVQSNFQKVVESENSSSDGDIREIIKLTSEAGNGVKDFSVSMVLYSDTVHVGDDVEFRNALNTYTWNAAQMLATVSE